MNKPEISVVLGSYNRKWLLKLAIQSVRDNAITVPYEIIVVDGGSTDGALEWIIKQRDVITVVQHNRGMRKGAQIQRRSWGYFINLAFKCAQGKFVCMISDDCLLVRGSIMAAIEEYERLTEEGCRIGGVAFYWRNWPDEKEYKIHRTYGKRIAVNHGIFLRKTLEEVGWADEDNYRFYCADGDLSLKIWEAGYEIVDCKKAFVEHYVRASVRTSHSSSKEYKADLATSRARWRHLLEGPDPFTSDWPSISYCDPNNTASQFGRAPLGEVVGKKCFLFLNTLRHGISQVQRALRPWRTGRDKTEQ